MAANVRLKSMTVRLKYTPSAYQPCVLISCFNRDESDFGADSDVGDEGGEGDVEYARRLVKEYFLLALLLPAAPLPRGERERAVCLAEKGSSGTVVRVLNTRKIGMRRSRAAGIARCFKGMILCHG